jgi:quinoprotein glucose dehydrogenase
MLIPLLLAVASGQVIGSKSRYSPKVEGDDGQAVQSLSRIKVPAGMKVELFAAEPHCANLVALDLAPNGDCYVVETFRRDDQVLDMRDWPQWVEDDLAARTVADRVGWVMRRAPADHKVFHRESERVRLLRDTDRDGRVDWSSVFADGFDDLSDGVAAGVLWRDGAVWFTDMPNLWHLADRDGDGHAEERTILSTGYGVHYAFVGHDLHGLRMGPDGRLWFSCGDRGLSVRTPDGRLLDLPDAGAVLRCEPDGSGLELFHTGLRNPQELQFDEHGDLFTVDNNSDGGDQARLVHVVDGGDSGWNLGWQWARTRTPRSAWNDEAMWKPAQAGQPNWIVPCVRNLVRGPSGLTRDPGGLLPGEFAGSFLVCDFEGQWDNTLVMAFRTERQGAGHRISFERPFVERGIVATDCEFGADGALYVSDWVGGWVQTRRGRVWRIHDPAVTQSAAAREVALLLGGALRRSNDSGLVKLLSHGDQRVRQEAQYELAVRGDVGRLRNLSLHAADARTRRHSTFALWQIARGKGGGSPSAAVSALRSLLDGGDADLRGNAARAIGEAGAAGAPAAKQLIARLADPEPRVRFFAAIALGRLEAPAALGGLIELARETGALDRTLRHAAVMGLAGCGEEDALAGLAAHGSAAVRMAALLALRRKRSAECGRFLADADREVVTEAARAIDDLQLSDHLPALAAQLDDRRATELPLLRRAANAAFRLGTREEALRLARVAADRDDLPEAIRADALRALGEFDLPPARDRLLGYWRPCPPRAPIGAGTLEPLLERLLSSPLTELAEAAARHVEKAKLAVLAPVVAALASDAARPAAVRVAALDALAATGGAELRAVVEATLRAEPDAVRSAARRHLARLDPAQALAILARVLEEGSIRERQDACSILGELNDVRAADLLANELARLISGSLAPEVALDVLQAARRKEGHASIAALLAQHADRKPAGDKVAARIECAVGGDPARGRSVFDRQELMCVKCHKVGNDGAGEAGPDLAGVGGRRSPRELLESIVAPNQVITEGFAGSTLILTGDRILDGRIVSEDDRTLRLVGVDGNTIEVPVGDVVKRRPGMSAMPEGLAEKLEPRDLRDLIAWLGSLR